MKRKVPLATGQVYHIFSRSIADFKVFNTKEDYLRMIQLLRYYQKEIELKYSEFVRLKYVVQDGFDDSFKTMFGDEEEIVQLIAFCLMPTHIHLILKQLKDNGISRYCGDFLNSFSRYFNTKHKRKGPLWEEKFKNILVDSDEQLLHLTRYIHLNPVTASLVKKPEQWLYSSYREYLGLSKNWSLCDHGDFMEMESSQYRKFVNDRIAYQKELAKIKTLILD